jgi:aryl-alcohol dehydrogenase
MSGVPEALQQAISPLAPGGTCRLVGAPSVGTRFALDVQEILSLGRRPQGIGEAIDAARSGRAVKAGLEMEPA